jgi:hypothetical protein
MTQYLSADAAPTEPRCRLCDPRKGLKVKYRVHYPACHDDQYRDFLTRAEAEKFARERQNILELSPAYLNIHSWRTIWIEEIR